MDSFLETAMLISLFMSRFFLDTKLLTADGICLVFVSVGQYNLSLFKILGSTQVNPLWFSRYKPLKVRRNEYIV